MTEDSRELSDLPAVEESGREIGLRPTDPASPVLAAAQAVVEMVPEPSSELQGTTLSRVDGGPADKALVQEFLAGNRVAFEVLVRRHQDRVFRLCVRLLGSQSLAEEAAQEVFVKIFRSLDRFRGDSLFTTWMTRITLNHCRNVQAYRGRRHEKRHFSIDAPRETDDGGSVQRELPSPVARADDQLVLAQRLRIVDRELRELEPIWQDILVLRDVEGMAYEQIGEILDLSPGTVKSRLHRARNELKRRVLRHLPSDDNSKGSGPDRR